MRACCGSWSSSPRACRPSPSPLPPSSPPTWWTRSRRMKRETASQDLPGVRVGGARARLQGRPHPGSVLDRARQDSAEPALRHVLPPPAPARHRHQTGAPAGPHPVHQRPHRVAWRPPPRTSGGVWRLALGVATFALFDPGGLGLLGLPLAGLLLVAGPARRHEWAVAVLAAAAAVATLAPRADTPVDALVNAYVVLVSAAFVCMALLAPTGGDGGGGPWGMAGRACSWGGAGPGRPARGRGAGFPGGRTRGQRPPASRAPPCIG